MTPSQRRCHDEGSYGSAPTVGRELSVRRGLTLDSFVQGLKNGNQTNPMWTNRD